MILCLDFETSSLDEQRGCILQIGAVWLHGGDPFFRECRPNDGNTLIEEAALKVNGITDVHNRDRIPEVMALVEFVGWVRGNLAQNTKVQIAAWNAHFDHRYLMAGLLRAGIDHRYQPFGHRLIDVHSALAFRTIKESIEDAAVADRPFHIEDYHVFGNEVPNCDEASKMLGLPEEAKPHNALAGAQQVRAMLRRLLGDLEALP